MEKRFGKFVLLERLGGGGMAEVFRARLEGPQGFAKELALKLILPQLSDEPEFVKMFVHEATVAARLDHAAIVRIHEFDVVEGTYYIAMELVEGKDLRALMARANQLGRNLSVPEALFIAHEVARGLTFAHGELTRSQEAVIHRDISPHNIIISRAGEVKITDFGIAKAASAASLTRTGVVKGKAAYMSPEQSRGLPVDRRSDLFSLGCVLWEMLAGQRLFSGENDFVILEKLQNSPIPPPSRFNPTVSADLDKLVLRCLERNLERRIQRASELVRELDHLLVASGADRTTLLANLYRDLFIERPPGTQRLGVASPAVAEPPPERVSAPHASATSPSGSESAATLISEAASPPAEKAGGAKSSAKVSASSLSSHQLPTQIRPAGANEKTELLPVEGTSARPPMKWRLLTWVVVLSLAAALLVVFWYWLAPPGPSADEPSVTGAATAQYFAPVDEAVPSAPPPVDRKATASSESTMRPPSSIVDQQDKATPAAPPSTLPNAAEASESEKPAAKEKEDAKSYLAGKAPSARGTLELNVMPWAKVFYRGRPLGLTPFRGDLPAGEQQLQLVNEELGVSRTIKVLIKSGLVTRRLVDLREADH